MAGAVFISYRRGDSLSEARSIVSALKENSRVGSVFFDERTMGPGDVWPNEIRAALQQSRTVVVVVKDWDDWLGVGKRGRRRIDQANDWVRQELTLALKSDKRVIPVLVGEDQTMIDREDLPEELESLPDRGLLVLHQNGWQSGINTLMESICQSNHADLADEVELADLCNAVLRDYAARCRQEWEQVRPKRFVEPYLAFRNEDRIADRSEILEHGKADRSHESLLSDDEKKRPGASIAVEQYRRLFDHKRSRTSRGARVCVTEDAGSGKSVFTHHLRAVLVSDDGQSTLYDGQPALVQRWEGREETWPFDFRHALEQAIAPVCPPHGVTPTQVVDYALGQSRVCLILDALDQVTDKFTPGGERIERFQLLDHIFRFFNSAEGQHCDVVITGRSYAITREAEGARFPADRWTFATLEGFDESQQQRFLSDQLAGRELTELIPSYRDVGELLSVPVILSLIAEIAESDDRPPAERRLEQFQSRGDVYREAHERLADRAQKTMIAANATARARWEAILSAAAFQMMCDTQQRKNYAVTGSQAVASFRARVAGFDLLGRTIEVSDKDWEQLAKFSQLTNHASVEDCSGVMLSWKHRGWMEYFAGLFLARYLATDTAQLAEFTNDPDWHWVWRFAIETPADVANPGQRTASLTHLFARPAQGRRPNELIYRAWDVMTETAAGRDALADFKDEFQSLLESGNSVATQLDAGFLPCPPDPAHDRLTFQMGSPDSDKDAHHDEKPQAEMSVEPFEMSKQPTTRQQYRLYDSSHERDSEFVDELTKYSPGDDCPVILVSWYDAWCFARWCGWRLPAEVEWEYACRAGTTTRYWWGEEMDDSKCTYGTNHTTAANKSHANGWGLMEMSGNVYEWCDTWYHEEIETSQQASLEGQSRVLRGGSFISGNPLDLRSAYRLWDSPGGRFFNFGFRISRTP